MSAQDNTLEMWLDDAQGPARWPMIAARSVSITSALG